MQDTGVRSGRGVPAVLDILSSVAFIALCGVAIWTLLARRPAPMVATAAAGRPIPRAEAALPTTPLVLEGAAILGSNSAPVAMLVYSEFKCPFCGAFARNVFPALSDKYIKTGRVRFIFRHFPLDELHPLARPLAHASVCADAQQRFWDFHDSLFAAPKDLDVDGVQKEMIALGLDRRSYQKCMAARETGLRVQADVESGKALGVTGTPTFFVGRVNSTGLKVSHRITGAKPQKDFELILEQVLSTSGAQK